ncbi:putative E3 ubiquitin-protein ligase TRIML2 [Microtus ochrogaster]|uniref:Putative E3 ubiquitin-protein ligase TRIML2 n=1 Tax=Microtus ochrogaster TaxID=79684 RepID=A0A8J6KSQ5_MICOH|nr:putative E3 ubiquitin-protein ligase TRIML2 [Microtus ochrogaster]
MSQTPKPQLLPSIAEEAHCGTHLQPLQLFCDDDQTTVCSKCVQAPEHKQHAVYGIQEAAEYYRKLLQETLVILREKLEVVKSLLADEQERVVMLQKLSHLGRKNKSKLKANAVWVQKYLRSLQKNITELEKKWGEPAGALLQRSESLLLQNLKPAQITDLSSSLVIRMDKALLRLQRHVTLDPDTAHPSLVLSEDLRSMGFGAIPQRLCYTPGRLDFSASVLGAGSFSSGMHYWEVSVGQAMQWQLGICDCTERKNNVPQASGDKYLLMGSMMGAEYTFWVFPPLRKVSLRKQMYNVGVFVDCGCGQVSFYNVTEQSLIYSFFDLTFRGTVKPIFSLCIPIGDMNLDSLTVCLPQMHS